MFFHRCSSRFSLDPKSLWLRDGLRDGRMTKSWCWQQSDSKGTSLSGSWKEDGCENIIYRLIMIIKFY